MRDALALASDHWSLGSPASSKVMTTMATRCVEILERASYGQPALTALDRQTGFKLIRLLTREGLSRKSVSSYYGAFRRMLAIAGKDTVDWPSAPTPPRRTRDKMPREVVEQITAWLAGKGWANSADLARLLMATGLRIQVEGLSEVNLRVEPGEAYDTLHVRGKGDNERVVPVVDPEARAILASPERMAAMRALSYRGHLKRWNKGVAALGCQLRLATPHAIRHGYASEVLDKSGGNLVMVQELLGHADPATTAKYLHVDLAAKAKALTIVGDDSE